MVKTFQISLLILNDLPATTSPNCERQVRVAAGLAVYAGEQDDTRDFESTRRKDLRESLHAGVGGIGGIG